MTTWCMRIACWINNATNTHPEYVTLFASARQQWLGECASVLGLYVHCLSCLHSVGWDNSVGIATGYGLDGPRIEARWG